MTHRIALTLEYQGQAYHGWQRQSGDLPTIQAQVEYAVTKIAQQPLSVICAGRTDTGVHALHQVIHFDTSTDRPIENWLRGVDFYLPHDISVTHAVKISSDFHARFSAVDRTYHYIIDRSPTPPAIMHNLVTWLAGDFDTNLMQQASQKLLGEHDFSSFQGRSCQAKSPYREVLVAEWYERGPYLIFRIKANAFLHHMVRYLVGALVEVGRYQCSLDWFEQLLCQPDRQNRKFKLPAQGLYLTRVAYPQSFDTLLQSKYPVGQRLLPGLINIE